MRPFIEIIKAMIVEAKHTAVETPAEKVLTCMRNAEMTWPGVRFTADVEESYPNSIRIGTLRREGAPRGAAASAMKMVCQSADDNGVELTLEASRSHPKLIRYYHSFGFLPDPMDGERWEQWISDFEAEYNEMAKNGDPDQMDDQDMIRMPQSRP